MLHELPRGRDGLPSVHVANPVRETPASQAFSVGAARGNPDMEPYQYPGRCPVDGGQLYEYRTRDMIHCASCDFSCSESEYLEKYD